MTMREMIQTAKTTAHDMGMDGVTFAAHYGRNRRTDRGVRMTGLYPEEARRLGDAIADKIGDGARCNIDAGFACIWA